MELPDGKQQTFRRWFGRLHIFSADDDVKKVFGKMLVQQLLDAVTEFGGYNSDAAPESFKAASTDLVSRKSTVLTVMCVSASFIYSFFELSQLAGIGYAGKNGKRFFQRFADGAFDVVVGRVV